ncbi:hypothetical protein [Naasia lichenicola]|uniref:DUF8129 domain-containing protein n=1 Tax=Naasia lichenicola TaxID=2565933 RepID=A0A4S4FTT2_9MICO|nr:hypothetical protein [Naasia lichenicola]THG32996.1 hypothetical protein E6C64_01105 [Naasia lichenicola]
MTEAPERSTLPLPDYDHIPQGTLASRISALDEAGVTALLDYERAHGDRLPVLLVLEHRLKQLQAGAEPAGAVEQEMPEVTSSAGGSPVSPATSGPPINPPSQGVPTNPAQPR